MKGIERLEAEALEMKNSNITAIFEYLKTRKELWENFNNKEKSIKQMYKYMYNKASKHKIDNVAMIGDKLVYLWAITYFSKSNEELGLNEKKVMPPSADEVIKKFEKKKDEKKEEENKSKDNQITLFEEAKE